MKSNKVYLRYLCVTPLGARQLHTRKILIYCPFSFLPVGILGMLVYLPCA